MGIYDRDYMRGRTTDSSGHSDFTKGAVIAVCIVAGAVIVGTALMRNRAEEDQAQEAESLRNLHTQIYQMQAEANTPESIRKPVDVNTATFEELRRIPYMRDDLAQAIIKGRPYRKLEELTKLDNLKAKRLEQYRPFLTIGPKP